MRRATFVLGLASSAVVVALLALVFRMDLPQPTSEPRSAEIRHAQQDPSIDTEARGSAATTDRSQAPDDPQVIAVEEAASDEWGFIDEEHQSEVRERATSNVQALYAVLIDSLALSPSEKDALLSLLVEDQIASTTMATSTGFRRGKPIDREEQSARIASIIGESKLRQFQALQQNLNSYTDLHHISSTLDQTAVPITTAQRDRMLEILIEVQNQELTLPGADAERGTIENLEYRLAEMDERERLVLEQAASVLSAEQVRYMFERYQRLWYQRSDALERQKKRKAANPTEDFPLYAPSKQDPLIDDG